MQFTLILLVLTISVSCAFVPQRFNRHKLNILRLNEQKYDIVPVEKENMQSAAAVTGGILGLVLFGPVGALVLAAITNFVSKKDDEAGEALRGLGKTVVESYNFLTKLNGKYDLTGKVVSSVDSAIDGTENETMDTVKKTITNVSSKVSDLNSEFNLVGKASDAIKVAASLSDTAIEKVIELNEKYDFVETTKKVAGEAVNKIKESTNK